MSEPKADIIGKPYGKWEVVEFVCYRGPHRAYRCRCECGAEQILLKHNLTSGATRGCRACGLKDSRAARVKWNFPGFAVPYASAVDEPQPSSVPAARP